MPKRTKWEPSPTELQTIREMAESGHSITEIAAHFKRCHGTLSQVMKSHNIVSTWQRKPPQGNQTAIVPCEVKTDHDPEKWISPADRFRHLYK